MRSLLAFAVFVSPLVALPVSARRLAAQRAPLSAQDEAYWAPLRSFAKTAPRDDRRGLDRHKRRVLIEFDTQRLEKRTLIDLVESAKSNLLREIRRENDESIQNFAPFPFLSLDLSEVELRKLNALKALLASNNDPIRYRIEPSPLLYSDSFRSYEVRHAEEVQIEELMRELGAYDIGQTGIGWSIVIVDEGVNPEVGTFRGSLEGGSLIEGPPACGTLPSIGAGVTYGMNPTTLSTELNHGTMVASVAAWAAPEAGYVSIRVGAGNGALVPDVIAALIEVECRWRNGASPVAAVVLSMTNVEITESSNPSHFKSMRSAIEALWERDIPVVISAGNDGPYPKNAFPASLEAAVTVGGVYGDLDHRVSSSNWSKGVDLVAPGFLVALPVPGSEWDAVVSGTSVSAPFVAGAIGLLRQAHPKCSIKSILDALIETGIPVLDDFSGIEIPLLQIRKAFDELNGGCELAPADTPPDGEVATDPASSVEPEPSPLADVGEG